MNISFFLAFILFFTIDDLIGSSLQRLFIISKTSFQFLDHKYFYQYILCQIIYQSIGYSHYPQLCWCLIKFINQTRAAAINNILHQVLSPIMPKKPTTRTTRSAAKGQPATKKIIKNNNRRGKSQQSDSDSNMELNSQMIEEEEIQFSKEKQEMSEELDGSSQSNSDDEEDGEDDDSDEEQSSSITPIAPENLAVKQMTFRSTRGTKMNYLMNRKKQEQEDPFWQQHGNYFGDLDGDEQDEQSYQQSSSGKDIFDSDFGQTESQHSDGEEGEEQKKKKQIQDDDENKIKQKRRQKQLMKKINVYKQKSTPAKKTTTIKKKPKNNQQEEIGNRYIHQMFSQEQLLGEAAHTQYYNWISLNKLISIETEKKDFSRKQKHVAGDKIVYRDRYDEKGERNVSYQLVGVEVNAIKDLTEAWQQQ